MQPQLTIIALSLGLIVFLGVTCVVFALISMWKENRFGWPLRGIIWFTLAIAGSCAVIALLAGYGAAIIDTSAVSTPTNSGRTRWRRSNNKSARCRLRPGVEYSSEAPVSGCGTLPDTFRICQSSIVGWAGRR